MPKRTKSYEADLPTRLRDPEYAIEYLRSALEDQDEHADAVFLLALRDVAQANLKAVLKAVGLNLSVQLASST